MLPALGQNLTPSDNLQNNIYALTMHTAIMTITEFIILNCLPSSKETKKTDMSIVDRGYPMIHVSN